MSGFEELSTSKQLSIMRTIASAEKNKVDTATIKTAAKISAKTNIGIVFAKMPKVELGSEEYRRFLKGNGREVKTMTVDGFSIKDKGRDTVYVGADLSEGRTAQMVLVHEITHALKGTNGYDTLAEIANKNITKKDRKAIENAYRAYSDNKGVSVSDEVLEEEVTSWFIEHQIDGQATLDKLVQEKPTFVQRLAKKAKEIATLFSTEDKTAYRESRKLANLFIRTVNNYKSGNQIISNNYAIGYTKDNKPVVIVEEDILKGIDKNDWVSTVKQTIKNKFSEGVPVAGRIVKLNKVTREEFTSSKNAKYYRDNDNQIYRDKFTASNNLDEIILASTNYINEDLNHLRKDNIKDFARGDVLIRVGSNDYGANVLIGFTSAKEMVLYDIIDFNPTKIDIKKTDTPNGQKPIRSRVSNTHYAQKTEKVNTSVKNNFEK